MQPPLLIPFKKGDDITAEAMEKLRLLCNENRVTVAGSGPILMRKDATGTTLSLDPDNPTLSPDPVVPFTFVPQPFGKGVMYGGSLAHPNNEVFIEIPDSDPLTLADGDNVWLVRTGANTWAFGNGPSWPSGTGQLYWQFVTVAVSSGVVSISDTYWYGGNLVWPERFACLVTIDGTGVAGDHTTDCSYTYTFKSLGGIQLGTTTTPKQKRTPKIPYLAPSTNSYGEACIAADGTFVLLSCCEEVPDSAPRAICVSGVDKTVQLVGSEAAW